MEIHHISRRRYLHTIAWAVLASIAIVTIAAGLGRATVNLKAALTDKPDVGIYLLLPNEHITKVTLLRERETERDYLIETPTGPKLVKLKFGEQQWYVSEMEELHEDSGADSSTLVSPVPSPGSEAPETEIP